MAHKIWFEGEEHRLSIAEISDDGLRLKIMPFETEIASTRWIEGTVEIVKDTDKYTWRIIEQR